MDKLFCKIIVTLCLCFSGVFSIHTYIQAENRPLDTDDRYYNLIIICLDTLRADHLSCYGYFRNTSPNIDELAKNGILFEWAITQSNHTLPSHASLFTSKYVRSHKVATQEHRLRDDEITLAEILRDKGYKTAAFIYNAKHLDPIYALNQGFSVYEFGEEDDKRPSFEKTLPQALKWIEQHKDDKWFIFLHANDIHSPYHSPDENFFDPDYKGRLDDEYFDHSNPTFVKNNLSRIPREIEHIIAHYDGGIKYVDGFIDELMQQLKKWDLWDKTIIMLLSDHGEILDDHGLEFWHGESLYDEEIHVPLIIVHPKIKQKGMRIKQQVQLIDIMPTILDFLDIDGDNLKMEGESLVSLIEGREKENFNKYAYAECIKDEEKIFDRLVGIRTSAWKLIGNVRKFKEIKETFPLTIQQGGFIISMSEEEYELYDLQKDPKETNNLFNQGYKEIEAELLDKLLSTF